jgi:hypothetical protein
MAKVLPILWVDDSDTFGCHLLPWKRLSKALSFAWRVLPRCIALTSWSADGGVGDVIPLHGGIALEGCAC